MKTPTAMTFGAQTSTESTSRFTKSISLLIVGGIAALFAGCASEPDSHIVSAPPPPAPGAVAASQPVVVVAPTPAPSQNGVQTVVVTQAPPAAVSEVAKERPSSNHVWVPGYYTWRNNQYTWVAGHWEVPPTSSSKWIAPKYEPVDGAYRFTEGYWE